MLPHKKSQSSPPQTFKRQAPLTNRGIPVLKIFSFIHSSILPAIVKKRRELKIHPDPLKIQTFSFTHVKGGLQFLETSSFIVTQINLVPFPTESDSFTGKEKLTQIGSNFADPDSKLPPWLFRQALLYQKVKPLLVSRRS